VLSLFFGVDPEFGPCGQLASQGVGGRHYPEVIVVAGLFDYAALRQAGFHNIADANALADTTAQHHIGHILENRLIASERCGIARCMDRPWTDDVYARTYSLQFRCEATREVPHSCFCGSLYSHSWIASSADKRTILLHLELESAMASTYPAVRICESSSMPDGATTAADPVGHLSATGSLPSLAITGAWSSSAVTLGSASALPATPAGYLGIQVAGTTVKIPFYNMGGYAQTAENSGKSDFACFALKLSVF
jgi:hypothetical protein